MIKCPFCGKEYEDTMQYCPFCGSDNLEDDGFKKTSKVPDDVKTQPKKKVIRSGNNIESELITIEGFSYKMEFDMDNAFEKSQYELIKVEKERHNKGLMALLGTIVMAFIMLLIGSSFEKLMFPYVIGMIFLMIAIPVALGYVAQRRKLQKAYLAYIKYDVELRGGRIVSYDDYFGRLVYELDGASHVVEVYRGRHHRPVNY